MIGVKSIPVATGIVNGILGKTDAAVQAQRGAPQIRYPETSLDSTAFLSTLA